MDLPSIKGGQNLLTSEVRQKRLKDACLPKQHPGLVSQIGLSYRRVRCGVLLGCVVIVSRIMNSQNVKAGLR